jgi:hypothetical protein
MSFASITLVRFESVHSLKQYVEGEAKASVGEVAA